MSLSLSFDDIETLDLIFRCEWQTEMQADQ